MIYPNINSPSFLQVIQSTRVDFLTLFLGWKDKKCWRFLVIRIILKNIAKKLYRLFETSEVKLPWTNPTNYPSESLKLSLVVINIVKFDFVDTLYILKL